MKQNLFYPIEFYYPDFDFNLPSMEDQILISIEYTKYIKTCIQRNTKIDEKHIAIENMKYLLERKKQSSYFQGVRDILNLLLTEEKQPEELFISMFPDRESLVTLFQQQFSDACELLIIEEYVDWEKMNLISYNEYKNKQKETKLDALKEILAQKSSLMDLMNEKN